MTLSGCFSSKNSDVLYFQSNKKPFFECQIKNLKDSQIFPSAGSSNFLLSFCSMSISCAASLLHTDIDTHTLFTSPHHLQASHVFLFASLISSIQPAAFSCEKVNIVSFILWELWDALTKCYFLFISVSIKFIPCAFLNIEVLKKWYILLC